MAYSYRRYNTRYSSPQFPPPTTMVNPAAGALVQVMNNSVRRLTSSIRPNNTKKVVDPKRLEFEEYCHHAHPNDQFPLHLNFEKVFFFMFYQTFREKKESKSRWKQGQERFNRKEYDEMLGSYITNGVVASTIDVANFPLPKHPMQIECWKHYRMVIRNIYNEQVSAGQQSLPWDHIWQGALNTLSKHVRERKVLVRRANYAEKYSNDFAPYAVVARYNDIERVMFNKANVSSVRSQVTALRHRYCLLMLTSGILRCESLYRAELSDFFSLIHPKLDRDVHQPSY